MTVENTKPDSPPVPLTLEEKRIIAGQLFELKVLRTEIKQLQSHEAEELAQYEKEKALWSEQIAAEQKAFELSQARVATAEKERDLQAQEAQFYKNALKGCQNAGKRGFWCGFWRFLTFGVHRCR